MMRLKEDLHSLPAGFINASKMVVYRSYFDEYGFCNYEPLSAVPDKTLVRFRNAYRQLWLDDLGGYVINASNPASSTTSLKLFDPSIEGIAQVEAVAARGCELISQLQRGIADMTVPASQLGEISSEMLEVDRKIEELGFQYPPLGPITRMFVFGKENLSGTDPLQLASQMKSVYQDLKRRCMKLVNYYSTQS